MAKEIKLKIKSNTLFKPTKSYKGYVTISNKMFQSLCKKFGSYGVGWYFINQSHVKYFNTKKNRWEIDYAYDIWQG